MAQLRSRRSVQASGFRFSIRKLLGAVSLLGILFAVLSAVSLSAAFLLAGLSVLVFLHLAAAVIATRLGAATDQQLRSSVPIRATPCTSSRATNMPTSLRNSHCLSRYVFVIGAIAAVGGGTVGALALSSWGKVGWSGLIVGSLSTGLVTALVGGSLASFVVVASGAWTEATQRD